MTTKNTFRNLLAFSLATLLFLPMLCGADSVSAQEKGKGDLEDFADDYEEDKPEKDSSSDEAVEFFLWAFFNSIGDLAYLWGGTPETEFGPFPSFPYADGDGFMTNSDDFRSYFFNTEFNYQYLTSHSRSFGLKWETQFVGT
ncbi:hypothetical protein MJD09_19140, partial [bacterium]|nr:hypothetical protein [bacterium]